MKILEEIAQRLDTGAPWILYRQDLAEILRSVAASTEAGADTRKDAERYRWLRSRDIETIQAGGVFAGMTPDNLVLSGADLDAAIDTAQRANTDECLPTDR